MAAQNRLSARFGIEGSPDVLLMSGGQEEVLRRAEELTAGLEDYQRRGVVKSIFSPTSLIPSRYTQIQRARPLAAIDLKATARAVEDAVRARGFRTEPFQPFINRLRELAQNAEPLSVEQAAEFLPQGLLDNSIRKTGNGNYVAVVAFYVDRSRRDASRSRQRARVVAAPVRSVRQNSPSTRSTATCRTAFCTTAAGRCFGLPAASC